jgi:hypothetical protein
MTSQELELVEALRRYAKDQEAEASVSAPLSLNSTRAVMERIDREEARQEVDEGARTWFSIFQSRTALAMTAALAVIAVVLFATLSNSTVQFALALPQGIKGANPTDPDYFLDSTPRLSVDWKRQTASIPLRTGGKVSGTISPKPPPARS